MATHTGGPAANLHDLGVSLALAWCESYDATTPWAAEIAEIPLGQLTYLFDLAPSQGAVGADDADDRVVGVWGNTTPAERAREASRQRGFLPDPAKWSHVGYDRGHFIAHSLGGGMDLNFFPQASDLNRGNSGRGRRWRRLERLAATRRDAFVFVRPVYTGNTWTPRCLDFGVVSDGTLEFESFDNRPIQT